MRLIDAVALNLKLVSLNNIAITPSQKALLGRVFYIVDQMPIVDKDINVHNKWISVKDRMPPNDLTKVLTYGAPVTHWMPLPEPPKEEGT